MDTEEGAAASPQCEATSVYPEVELYAYLIVLLYLCDNKHYQLVRALSTCACSGSTSSSGCGSGRQHTGSSIQRHAACGSRRAELSDLDGDRGWLVVWEEGQACKKRHWAGGAAPSSTLVLLGQLSAGHGRRVTLNKEAPLPAEGTCALVKGRAPRPLPRVSWPSALG